MLMSTMSSLNISISIRGKLILMLMLAWQVKTGLYLDTLPVSWDKF